MIRSGPRATTLLSRHDPVFGGAPVADQIPTVKRQDMYEIKSSLILQPGSAALTDGLTELQRIIERRASR
jgi:hypothetical protein